MLILSMLLFACLLVWLQGAAYRRWWDKKLELRVGFSSHEAFEGQTLQLAEELTNRKLLPLPWVVVKFQISRNLVFLGQTNYQISDDYYQNDMFSLNMFQRITRRLDFVCGRRGYYCIKNLDLASSNIFISSRLVKAVPCEESLTVFPKLIPFEDLALVYRQIHGEIMARRFHSPDPFSFRGIREYAPGDSFSMVNFKATAKTGELMVNVNSPTASQELVILLNLEAYSAAPSEDVYEEGIRLAASIAGYYTGLGLSVGLVCNGADAVTGEAPRLLPGSGGYHHDSILRRLARIDLKRQVGPMAPLLETAREEGPAYLLISSCDSREMTEAFDRLCGRVGSCRWILPALADTVLRTGEDPRITRWEVRPYDPPTNLYQKAAV